MSAYVRRRPSERYPPHPAPGSLRIVQDLLNTLEHRTGEDVLHDPAAARTWLAGRDLLSPDAPFGPEAWQSLVELREALRRLVAGTATPALAERLNRAIGTVRPRMSFVSDGSLRLTAAADGWQGAVDRILLTVFEAKLAGRWSRLKLCHEDSCRRVFYDAAKNRLGKWCDVRRCGVPLHSKTYRRRQARRGR